MRHFAERRPRAHFMPRPRRGDYHALLRRFESRLHDASLDAETIRLVKEALDNRSGPEPPRTPQSIH